MQPHCFSFEVPEVAQVYVSHYSDRTFIVLTETNRLGTLISVEADNPEETGEDRIYSVRTLFGGRSDEFSEALILGLAKVLHPFKPILFSLAVSGEEKYSAILQAFTANLAQFQ
jgi:hypothetical protein